MEYYKIIRNGTVVGAGTTFLKWYPSKRQFFYCDINSAERVQDFLTETLYYADWLKDAPSGATEAIEADVRIIDATEYDEIIEQLGEGEIVPVEPDTEPDVTPEPSDELELERPMTIQEMREKIADLISMNAKDNISEGSYFMIHDEIYLATEPIIKGHTIMPGYNCERKALSDIIGNGG